MKELRKKYEQDLANSQDIESNLIAKLQNVQTRIQQLKGALFALDELEAANEAAPEAPPSAPKEGDSASQASNTPAN